MDGSTTIRYLQNYIRDKDNSASREHYFMKLSEEVGELARAMRKDAVRQPGADVKNTIDEELWDVIYYAITLANCYDVDLEKAIRDKEELNRVKYNTPFSFEEGR